MLNDRDAAELVILDPRDAAESAGLVYVTDEEPGYPAAEGGEGIHLSASRTSGKGRCDPRARQCGCGPSRISPERAANQVACR
jgi:hypothetical protein